MGSRADSAVTDRRYRKALHQNAIFAFLAAFSCSGFSTLFFPLFRLLFEGEKPFEAFHVKNFHGHILPWVVKMRSPRVAVF
jgi:hypothetical protein